MPFKTGSWGPQAKERSKKRLAYFKAERAGDKRECTKWEKIAARLLGAERVGQPTDLKWKKLNVDVKTSHLLEGKRYYFYLKSQMMSADLFFCICLDDSGEAEKIYLIPRHAIRSKTAISLKRNSDRFSKYLFKKAR